MTLLAKIVYVEYCLFYVILDNQIWSKTLVKVKLVAVPPGDHGDFENFQNESQNSRGHPPG